MNLHEIRPPLPTKLGPGVRVRVRTGLEGLDIVFQGRTGTIRGLDRQPNGYWQIELDPVPHTRWNDTLVTSAEVEIIG